MSNTLILIVGLVYFVIGFDLIRQHKYGLGISFIAYALANIGLYMAARGI